MKKPQYVLLALTAVFISVQLQGREFLGPDSYVQDGLIVHLDGIDNTGTGVHDSTATVWKDLKGSLDFTLVGGKESWGNNCFVTSGKSASAGQITKYNTVEAVFQPTASSNGYVFYTHTKDRAIFMHPTSAALWFRTSEGVQAAIDLISYNIVHHVAATYSGNNVVAAYRDSKEVPVRETASVWNIAGTAATIGGRANGQYGTTGRIYALRFYDRQLSEEEIFHNYAVDRARFFGDYSHLCGFSVSAVEPQMFDGITGPTPEPSVITSGGEKLVKGEDFEYTYENNDKAGTATVVVVGKGEYEGKSYPVEFRVILPIYAAAESCGTADGSSWTDAMAFTSALSSAVAEDVICVKEGTIPTPSDLSVSVPLWIYGGYTGDASAPFSKTADARTVLDGGGSAGTLLTVNAAAGEVIVKGMGFTGAKVRGFRKTGSSGLTMEDCDFTSNGYVDTDYAGGRGAAISGSGTALLRSCTFRYNMANNGNWYFGNGVGLNVSSFSSLRLEGCSFVGNGLAPNLRGGTTQQVLYGSALYTTIPVIASGCEFRLNHAADRNDKRGGAVALSGGTGHVFSNCLFVANSGTFMQYAGTSGGGVVRVAVGSGKTVSFERCTFAYNLSDSQTCANLNIVSGSVTVRNCVFSDAIVSSRYTGGKYIHVYSGANCTVSDSLFPAGSENDAVKSVRSYDLVIGKNVTYGDACFRTGSEDVLPSVLTTSNMLYFDPDAVDDLELIDVRLLGSGGVYSAAIDQGAEEDAVGSEIEPNGGRLDLGAYGGTENATPSNPDEATIESLEVSWPGGLSFPKISFALGGEAGALYNADVEVFCATGALITAGEWIKVGRFYGLHRSDSGEVTCDFPLATGDTCMIRAVVHNGASRVTRDWSGTVEGTLPEWFGKGGGDDVLHVWAGSIYEETGADWGHAYRTLADALAAWEPTKREIWIAGTNVVKSSLAKFSPSVPVAIRGGFTGAENEAAERPASSCAQLDGEDTAGTIFTLENGASATVVVERVEFYRANIRGFRKTGAGRIELSGCRFINNARNTCNNGGGYGALITGTAAAEALVTNCWFEGQFYNPQSGGNHNNGRALYVQTFKGVEITDTVFVQNGGGLVSGELGASSPNRNSKGTTLCIENAPALLRRCDFRANRGTVGGEYQPGWGGVVSIGGAAGGSRVENCLFIANSDLLGGNADTQRSRSGSGGGALVFRLTDAATTATVKNCTFAYNLADAVSSAAALTVQSGYVDVKNCIFHSNRTGGGTLVATDIAFAESGTGAISYSMFDSDIVSSVSSAGTAPVIEHGTCRFGNPHFAVTNDIDSLLTSGGLTYFRQTQATLAALLALDAHLKSPAGYFLDDGSETSSSDVVSPAIDGGDPSDAFSLEPTPNGHMVNLGRYGNTPKASRTPIGQPAVESVDVEFTDGWSQPEVSVVLGGAGMFSATVSITLFTNGVQLASAQVPGIAPGGTATYRPAFYLIPGDVLTVKVSITAANADIVEPPDTVVEVNAELPPWFGKGGDPSRIVHVRPGATGTGDGTSWTDACTDLMIGLGKLTGERRELWVSGDFSQTAAISITERMTIRGGFNGSENTPEERSPGMISEFHGQNIAETLVTAANPAGETVTLDSLALVRAHTRAVKKTGAGDLVMAGCFVASNGLSVSNADGGYGIHVNGAGAASLIVSNCIFRNQTFGAQCSGGINDGGAVKAVSCAAVRLSGSSFIHNGASYGADIGAFHPYRNASGRAVYIKDSPLTMLECAIVGNRGTSGFEGNLVCGGTVTLVGMCGGSEIRNCRFLGNANDFSYAGGSQPTMSSYGGGALVLRLTDSAHTATVENCTFAWNLSDTYKSAAGVSVVSGYADIRNCIFSHNRTGNYTVAAKDVSFAPGAEGHVAFALFDSDLAGCVSVEDGGVVVSTNTFVFGDAFFVSTTDMDELVTTGSLTYFKRNAATQTALEALDCHLRSHIGYIDGSGGLVRYRGVKSPAVDAGDPASDWSREPDVPFGTHGKRVNLGSYGNTPEAALSPVRGTIIRVR